MLLAELVAASADVAATRARLAIEETNCFARASIVLKFFIRQYSSDRR
jgi:hypothetical protein